MRTLALLAALLLLAFQARAQALQETAEQVPAQNQTGVEDQDLPGDEDYDLPEDDDQDLPEDEDQDVAVSLLGQERLTRQLTAMGVGKALVTQVARRCRCRPRRRCRRNKVNKALRRVSHVCRLFRRRSVLCCN